MSSSESTRPPYTAPAEPKRLSDARDAANTPGSSFDDSVPSSQPPN